MNRSWLRVLIAPLVMISLVGCSASVENQTEDGIQEAKEEESTRNRQGNSRRIWNEPGRK